MMTLSPPLLVAIGIATTAFAQILIKQASYHDVMTSSWLAFMAVAAGSYALSFLLYSFILKFYPLNKVYPVMTVAQIALVTLYGLTIGEVIGARHALGLAFGVLSIYLILA